MDKVAIYTLDFVDFVVIEGLVVAVVVVVDIGRC